MNRTKLAAASLLLFGATAFAQDAVDAETRFHRAYEQEVVDGKTADAARVYLAMMSDEKVPERLRQEAKFRFAVTSVLLGRADEARAHFAELAKDAKTPESLRARAAEYLDAAKGIGVGSELDKKLQALVFDLARTSPAGHEVPAAYRDFEVIGRAAVPFLKQLLQHADPSLRQHAFRLLLRMREPGSMELWTPAVHQPNDISYSQELKEYLQELPDESPVLERKLLALDDKALATEVAMKFYRPTLSADFLRAAAARKTLHVSQWFDGTASTDEPLQRLRLDWIRGDDPDLAVAATLSFLRSVPRPIPEWAAPADLFPFVMKALLRSPQTWRPWDRGPTGHDPDDSLAYTGLRALATAAPTPALLDALEATLAKFEAATPQERGGWIGLFAGIAYALDERKLGDEERTRYLAIVRRRLEVDDADPPFTWVTGNDFDHVRTLLATLPLPQAEEFTAWAFSRDRKTTLDWGVVLPKGDPARVGLALVAYRAGDPRRKASVLAAMGLTANAPRVADPAFARAILGALPDFVRAASDAREKTPPVAPFAFYACQIPAEEARERLVELVAALASWHDPKRRAEATWGLLWSQEPDSARTYFSDVVQPVLERIWTTVRAEDRDSVLLALLSRLGASEADARIRQEIATFALRHAAELPRNAGPTLAAHISLFPPAAWVPQAAPAVVANLKIPADVADAAAREMTKDPAAVNESVFCFVRLASNAVQTEIIDRLLRTAPLDVVRTVVFDLATINGSPADGHALADALDRALAAEKPDLDLLARLVPMLGRRRPTDALFPAVRLLLASPTTSHVVAGIETATSLGREELLPPLVRVLDSMEVDTRAKAKEAIDAIVALRKLKEETRRDAGAAPGGK
jgi:hypothetical protein